MPFTTRIRVKDALLIPAGVTQYDSRIDSIVSAVNARVLQEVGLPGMTVASYEERFDVDDPIDTVFLRYRPVVAVAALTNSTERVAAGDFSVNKATGRLRLLGVDTMFTMGRETVKVTYTAGFPSAPEPLVEAATAWSVALYKRTPNAGMSRESVEGYEYSLDPAYAPIDVQAALGHYRPVFPPMSAYSAPL